MFKTLLLAGLVTATAACGSKKADTTERYAVGTYLYDGNVMSGSTNCTFDAPPGVLDGTMVKSPGTITKKCPKGASTIVADYADRVVPTFPNKWKVGEKVELHFELRDAQNRRLTPTLSEMGVTTLEDGCTALKDLDRGGAQDTGRDPFMSATAAAPGTCKVMVEIELPAKTGGTTKLHAEQVVAVK